MVRHPSVVVDVVSLITATGRPSQSRQLVDEITQFHDNAQGVSEASMQQAAEVDLKQAPPTGSQYYIYIYIYIYMPTDKH